MSEAANAIRTMIQEDLVLDGIIDSLGMMQLVAFVEERFEIEIPDAEMTSANFASVNAIAALVEKQKG